MAGSFLIVGGTNPDWITAGGDAMLGSREARLESEGRTCGNSGNGCAVRRPYHRSDDCNNICNCWLCNRSCGEISGEQNAPSTSRLSVISCGSNESNTVPLLNGSGVTPWKADWFTSGSCGTGFGGLTALLPVSSSGDGVDSALPEIYSTKPLFAKPGGL